MDLGLEGRVALVTASSSGLGRASAEALAAEGAKVVLTARGESKLRQVESDLSQRGAEVLAIADDISRPDAPAALVAAAMEHFGHLDIVVANAGGPPQGRALEVDDDAIHQALETNMLASVRLVRAALPHMTERGWGRFCCIASYSIVQPLPNLALSNLARTALWAWAKTAAADIARQGGSITLNLVCPGPHTTPRMVELGGMAGSMGDPADFGRVVAFLCSSSASFVNGAAIVVDGGSTTAL